jgi:hypothetical protein
MSLPRVFTSGIPQQPPPRIVLIDNTGNVSSVARSHSHSPASSDPSLAGSHLPHRINGDGRRETLRKAIAERKYKRWSMDPSASTDGREGDDKKPDERAEGVVVERAGELEDQDGYSSDGGNNRNRVGGGGGRGGGGYSSDCSGGIRRGLGGVIKADPISGTGQRRRNAKGKPEIAAIDILYENQRGYESNFLKKN